MDFELAEMIAKYTNLDDAEQDASNETRESKVRSSAGHTSTIEALFRITDTINHQTATLVGMEMPKGKKPPRVQTQPRPVSALQIVLQEREEQELNDEMAKLGIQF